MTINYAVDLNVRQSLLTVFIQCLLCFSAIYCFHLVGVCMLLFAIHLPCMSNVWLTQAKIVTVTRSEWGGALDYPLIHSYYYLYHQGHTSEYDSYPSGSLGVYRVSSIISLSNLFTSLQISNCLY